ncbi:MAG TPA: DinB family protein [Cyclobacteriaceae bacterium]|nr:DinB family protein [Cyclobacteriaceae bacterium]
MNASLQKLFDKIELQRAALLSSVSHLSEQQLNARMIPGKWSVAEILSHIISAERLSLMYLNKKILAIETTKDSGIWEEVKINLLKLSQRMPGLKFKVPRTLEEKMTQYNSITALTAEWDLVRKDLADFLDKIPDAKTERMIYRHVRAGYLNIRHALIFFREHIIHHTPQIKRLVNAR